MISNTGKQECSSYLNSRTKRCFDIVVCLLLLFPALAVIAFSGLVILIREGRPVFFVHRRVGKNGRLFRLFKLRTLHPDTNPYKSSAGSENDLLVTTAGKSLRRHRLDELPQLFSVLTGRMSLVGPRPELPNVVASYKSIHKKRLLVKPGITGLWQITGNHNISMREGIKYDLYYLRSGSLWLDIKILVMTIPFVLDPK